MRTSIRLGASALLLSISLSATATGCSSTTSGTATNESHSSTSTKESDRSGAPAVQEPIQTDKLERSPCSLLSQQQLDELGVPTRGVVQKVPEGPQCVWRGPSAPYGYRIAATFLKIKSVNPGLSGVYEARNRYQDFRQIKPLNSFPAVIANPLKDDSVRGNCAIEVGLSDQQSLDIGLQIDIKNPNYQNACSVATEIAGALTSTARNLGES